jgi:outer membrane lipoprotein
MKVLFPLVFLFLVGCSNVPVAIKEAPQPDWQLGQVSQQPAQHQGEAIRWGGQIVKVENSDAGSLLHVVQFPLNSYGRPDIDRRSQGRFLAQTSQFIDPYIYKSGTLITVAGTVSGDKTITIDKKTMTIPVVTIGETYRWMSQRYNDDRYWHGYPYYYDRFGYGLSYPHWRSRWYYGRGYYW